MKVSKTTIVILVLISCASLHLKAQDKKEDIFNPINHSVTSQMIAPDARAAGMADIGAATDPDINSQYWNPAKYPFAISKAGVAINYTPWLRQIVSDMDLATAAGYYRIGDYSAVSASLRYFSLGEVIASDYTIKPYEMSIDAAYSLMLSEKFSLGAAVRWIHSNLTYDYSNDTSPGNAFAADIACYYNKYFNIGNRECQFAFGVNISNVGSKIRFGGSDYSEFIPANLRIGFNFMLPIDQYNRLSFSFDANKLLVPTMPTDDQCREALGIEADQPVPWYNQYRIDNYYELSSIGGIFRSFGDAPGGFKEELQEIYFSVGAEYVYNDRFSVRAGYHHESENKGNRKYFTVGAGFKLSAFSLDCGYLISTTKSNPLDQTLRFTLGFDIDGIKDLFHRR
ncbi:MAG: type IX secretion system outer membrane channel protein PorV [Bacteroidaceae bacterium]|nr:type IX secretion system outer membrane channel protein PorV [Bacteroidaceae bacterium]